MAERDTILITNTSLHGALCRELAARGLILRVAETWNETDRTDPERILGAYTWFYEGLRHPVTVWRMRRWLNRHRIPLFVWNQDAPHYLNRAAWRLDLLDRARLYDVYATHTMTDTARQFADSVIYLPNAADTERYHLAGRPLATMRDFNAYEFDVSFFGAMDGSRHKEMMERQHFFADLGKRLDALGIRHQFREATGMTADQQVRLIQGSRINLNFGAACDYGFRVASGLPERCYGIPACGGFLLSDRRTHARDDFRPGTDWAEFDGLDECVAAIRHWLANFSAARDIAERCHATVVSRHTYAHRAAALHRALLDWHAGRRGRLQ